MKDKKHRLKAKADKLYQQWVRETYFSCFLCSTGAKYSPVVGHHFINKSNSLALRFYKPNLIPLCMRCHCLIHAQSAMPNARIALIKGPEWLADLNKKRKETVRDNIRFYEEAINQL